AGSGCRRSEGGRGGRCDRNGNGSRERSREDGSSCPGSGRGLRRRLVLGHVVLPGRPGNSPAWSHTSTTVVENDPHPSSGCPVEPARSMNARILVVDDDTAISEMIGI